MSSSKFIVEVEQRSDYVIPRMCNCCLMETNGFEEICAEKDISGIEFLRCTVRIPLCIECEKHVKASKKFDIPFGLLGLLSFAIIGAAIALEKLFLLSIIPICVILIVYFRLRFERKLRKQGHSAPEKTVALKILKNKVIRFIFKNEEYAKAFAEMNKDKIKDIYKI
jgi:hypothetical protein